VAGQVQAGAVWGPLWLNGGGIIRWESDDGSAQGATQVDVIGRVYIKPFSRQTLALRFHHSAWYRANYFGQTFVGALSGVRGLPARFYEGTRRWVANAEYRIYAPLRVLTINLGGVLFTDVGQAWNRDESPRLSDAPVTYGYGLRLGFGKIAGDRVLRLDWARGPEGWITTFGFGMYFDFNLNGPLGY
jgi:outer membrane protein assembly factor BamA